MKDFKDCKECGYLYPKKTKLPDCYGIPKCPATSIRPIVKVRPVQTKSSTFNKMQVLRALAYKDDNVWVLMCENCSDSIENVDLGILIPEANKFGWIVEGDMVLCPECNAERT